MNFSALSASPLIFSLVLPYVIQMLKRERKERMKENLNRMLRNSQTMLKRQWKSKPVETSGGLLKSCEELDE